VGPGTGVSGVDTAPHLACPAGPLAESGAGACRWRPPKQLQHSRGGHFGALPALVPPRRGPLMQAAVNCRCLLARCLYIYFFFIVLLHLRMGSTRPQLQQQRSTPRSRYHQVVDPHAHTHNVQQ
jgi:hypothetical protein